MQDICNRVPWCECGPVGPEAWKKRGGYLPGSVDIYEGAQGTIDIYGGAQSQVSTSENVFKRPTKIILVQFGFNPARHSTFLLSQVLTFF